MCYASAFISLFLIFFLIYKVEIIIFYCRSIVKIKQIYLLNVKHPAQCWCIAGTPQVLVSGSLERKPLLLINALLPLPAKWEKDLQCHPQIYPLCIREVDILFQLQDCWRRPLHHCTEPSIILLADLSGSPGHQKFSRVNACNG